MGSKHADRLETYICRPGLVLSKENHLPNMLIGLGRSIKVNELAATMLKIAMDGNETQTMDNTDLRTVGQAILKVNGER